MPGAPSIVQIFFSANPYSSYSQIIRDNQFSLRSRYIVITTALSALLNLYLRSVSTVRLLKKRLARRHTGQKCHCSVLFAVAVLYIRHIWSISVLIPTIVSSLHETANLTRIFSLVFFSSSECWEVFWADSFLFSKLRVWMLPWTLADD